MKLFLQTGQETVIVPLSVGILSFCLQWIQNTTSLAAALVLLVCV